MKKFLLLSCALMVMICLSACQLPQFLRSSTASEQTPSAPLRMVKQVKVSLLPDPASCVVYRMETTLNPLMHLLRDMDYDKPVYNDEALERCQSYFSFTVRYATGERQSYRLLSHQYLKVGSERWYEISRDDALALTQFLMDHESDAAFTPDADRRFPSFLFESSAVQ